MNIQTFSQRTQLSPHTIRYYEKIGLLKNIHRSTSGHRCFTSADISWIEFIKRLKDMGMPLENMRRYADLRYIGESTLQQRMQLLQKHADVIKERIAIESSHLHNINTKIDYYQKMIANN